MCDEVNRAEKPEAQASAREDAATATPQVAAQVTAQVVDPEFARAENEDDDGYDPYSDRRPVSEPLFERDPWS